LTRDPRLLNRAVHVGDCRFLDAKWLTRNATALQRRQTDEGDDAEGRHQEPGSAFHQSLPFGSFGPFESFWIVHSFDSFASERSDRSSPSREKASDPND
jgi:hypothetical protein